MTRPAPSCAGTDHPDLFFSDDPAEVEQAKATCRTCPIATACFAGAVARDEQAGVWGGEVFAPLPADPMVVAEPVRIRVTVAACPGSRARYNAGCRCVKCKAQNAQYQDHYRHEGPAVTRAAEMDLFEQLTIGASA
jgi:hypothetical protein